MTTASILLTTLLLVQATPELPAFSARLLAAHESVSPGGQTELLVEIEIGKPWHIYDPLVLDTGLPTRVQFTLPPGVSVGDLRFPAPHLGKAGDLEYLAHAGVIRALAPLALAADVQPDQTLQISAEITGLACTELCLPVRTTARLALPVTPAPGKPANQTLFADARRQLAPLLSDAPYLKGSEVRVSKDRLTIDEPAELLATIRVERGHHIQDREPGLEGLIPSRLFVEKVAGLEFVPEKQQTWPAPETRAVPGLGNVREHSGELTIRVPFRIADASFPSGPVAVRLLFQYQACTDAGQCFPPQMAFAVVRFTADTPNPPPAAEASEIDARTGAAVEAAAPDVAAASGQPASANGVPPPPEPPAAFSAEQLAGLIPPFTPQAWAQHIPWVDWQPGLPEALSRAGYTVYVDYTATWCATCQVNKAFVLETEAVRAKMRELRVVPIRADFTSNNPLMYEEIAKWAPTVPVNLVYAPGKPHVIARLPTVLTRDLVIRALQDPEHFSASPAHRNLLFVLVAGFLGGLILNVMPCVLPVISIKILSFVQQAGEDRARILKLGLAFCAGIMVWFWAFAWLSTRGSLPWQYPQVVIGLSALLFVFSLSLFGVFEIVLPGAAAGTLDAITAREGYTGAFLKGLLATLLGTACTAPFLAGAMAYALTQPARIVFLVFSAAGLGMAAPYLLLSAQPAWLRFIPRPGPWLITFKQATGFVLLGTVIWLLWILANQIDGKGVVWTVAFLGFLALAVWMLGRIRPAWDRGPRAAMWTAAMAVALFGFYFCYFWMYTWPGASPASPVGSTGTGQPAAHVGLSAASTPPGSNAALGNQ